MYGGSIWSKCSEGRWTTEAEAAARERVSGTRGTSEGAGCGAAGSTGTAAAAGAVEEVAEVLLAWQSRGLGWGFG